MLQYIQELAAETGGKVLSLAGEPGNPQTLSALTIGAGAWGTAKLLRFLGPQVLRYPGQAMLCLAAVLAAAGFVCSWLGNLAATICSSIGQAKTDTQIKLVAGAGVAMLAAGGWVVTTQRAGPEPVTQLPEVQHVQQVIVQQVPSQQVEDTTPSWFCAANLVPLGLGGLFMLLPFVGLWLSRRSYNSVLDTHADMEPRLRQWEANLEQHKRSLALFESWLQQLDIEQRERRHNTIDLEARVQAVQAKLVGLEERVQKTPPGPPAAPTAGRSLPIGIPESAARKSFLEEMRAAYEEVNKSRACLFPRELLQRAVTPEKSMAPPPEAVSIEFPSPAQMNANQLTTYVTVLVDQVVFGDSFFSTRGTTTCVGWYKLPTLLRTWQRDWHLLGLDLDADGLVHLRYQRLSGGKVDQVMPLPAYDNKQLARAIRARVLLVQQTDIHPELQDLLYRLWNTPRQWERRGHLAQAAANSAYPDQKLFVKGNLVEFDNGREEHRLHLQHYGDSRWFQSLQAVRVLFELLPDRQTQPQLQQRAMDVRQDLDNLPDDARQKEMELLRSRDPMLASMVERL